MKRDNIDIAKLLNQDVNNNLGILTKKEVAETLGVDVRTLYRWWKSGFLPQPVLSLSGRCMGWFKVDFIHWIEMKRIASRN